MGVNRRTSTFAANRLVGALTLVLALLALSIGVAACGSDSDNGSASGSGTSNGDSPLAKLKEKGVVRMPSVDAPPSIFRSKEPKGFLSEQAVMVFKKMGIPKVETVEMDFGAVIPSIQSGRIDVGLGFYFTKERCNAISYTDPQLYYLDAYMVEKGNPFNIKSAQDVVDAANNKGLKPGGVTGAAELTVLPKLGLKKEISKYPDLPTALDALKAGRIDTVSWDNVTMAYLAQQPANADLEATEPNAPIVDGKPTPYAAGNGFHKDSADVAAEFSKVMNQMWADGEFEALAKKYSIQKESWPTEYPEAKSVEERCAEAT